ncbi:hypothetical protein I8752_11615 [Nostocaceae cyanobacterium CENA369]|uniref:Uncharacterized protein n=1 Tax=Dendronalium phyllosphericum CENA369 TaxID=1725256 RepID=A0A8J7I4L9_9NOST|nr:hypothetical protein [Dendronalium phyllosphericum CENA369]
METLDPQGIANGCFYPVGSFTLPLRFCFTVRERLASPGDWFHNTLVLHKTGFVMIRWLVCTQ